MRYLGERDRVTVRIPADIMQQLVDLSAKRNSVALNTLIVAAIKLYLEVEGL
jgi:predicted HicB family RNase H-like nuclease